MLHKSTYYQEKCAVSELKIFRIGKILNPTTRIAICVKCLVNVIFLEDDENRMALMMAY